MTGNLFLNAWYVNMNAAQNGLKYNFSKINIAYKSFINNKINKKIK